jgi:hypothetical protein
VLFHSLLERDSHLSSSIPISIRVSYVKIASGLRYKTVFLALYNTSTSASWLASTACICIQDTSIYQVSS